MAAGSIDSVREGLQSTFNDTEILFSFILTIMEVSAKSAQGRREDTQGRKGWADRRWGTVIMGEGGGRSD